MKTFFKPINFFIIILILFNSCNKETKLDESKDDINSNNWTRYQFDQFNSGVCSANPPTTKPSELWKITLSDNASTSPLLYKGRLYFAASDVFYCVSSSTGEEIWKVEASGGIYSEPAIYDDILYFGDDDWGFYALNPDTGASLWSRELNDDISACPIKFENLIIINDEDGQMYAFDAKSGEFVWGLDEQFGDKSPAIKDGIVYHITSVNNAQLIAVDASTGLKLWDIYLEGNLNNCSPTIYENMIIVGGTGHLYCIDIATQTVKWNTEFNKSLSFANSANIYENKVIIGSNSTAKKSVDAYIGAFDLESGEYLWGKRIDDWRFQCYSSTVTGENGVVICSVHNAGLMAINSKDGSFLWNIASHLGGSFSSPILDGGIIYAGGTKKMVAYK